MPYKTKIALLSPLLCCTLLFSCKKDKGTALPPGKSPDTTSNPQTSSQAYAKNMGGMRNWHRSHFYEAHGPHFPTPIYESYNLPDTAMAVSVLNDSTVSLLGNLFRYDRTDSAKQMHLFGTAWAYFNYGTGYGKGIAYFYAQDSIVFYNQDRHATTDAWTLNDVYNTYK